MFGREWKPGRATIVEARASNAPMLTHSESFPTGQRTEYVVDVQPDGDGPMFRATLLSPMDIRRYRSPSIGEVVPVLCDPKRQKVKCNLDDPSWLASKARSDAFDKASHAAPGSPAPAGLSGDLADLLQLTQQHAGDPEAMRRMGKMAEGRSAGVAWTPGAAQSAGAPTDDSAESIEQRLAKLQKLRDDGVLTAEEFAAQRQHIIDAL
jgi:hypothetical protein